MKKINSIDYGGKVIGIGLVFLALVPALLYGLSRFLLSPVIPALIYVSLGIGAVIEAGFGFVLLIELRQDRVIGKHYENNPGSSKTPQQILDDRASLHHHRQGGHRGMIRDKLGSIGRETNHMTGDNPRELPGFRKKSFALPFHNGMIWFEHLDGLLDSTSLVLEKLAADQPLFCRPSMPSDVGFVLDETTVNDEIVNAVSEALLGSGKAFSRVCFIGTDKKAQRKICVALKDRCFSLAFYGDLERAKEWLIPSSNT